MNKDLLDDRFGRFREIPLALAYKGHSVNGLCLSYAKRNEDLVKDGPVCWQSINASRLKIPGLVKFFFEASKLAKSADVIWACSDSIYGIIGCIISKILKVPIIFDIYDNFDGFTAAKIPIVKQLYRWAIRQSDAITCLSSSFANYLNEKYERNKHVYPIEFAVRNDLFKPLKKSHCRQMFDLPVNALMVGTAGGLSKIRDTDLLIDAFLHLRNKYPDMHLTLAGPLDGDLKIPEDPRIHYLGCLPFEKVPYLINSFDIAVVCYADDEFGKYCFPQKTREFMACDVPVIAAGVGGLNELFKDRPEWLYNPGDIQSLIDVIEKRISDRLTNYPSPPTWKDLAQILEKLMLQIQNENA